MQLHPIYPYGEGRRIKNIYHRGHREINRDKKRKKHREHREESILIYIYGTKLKQIYLK
jgi:hypothetical protein